MKILRTTVLAILLFSGLGILGYLIMGNPITISFTQEDVQEKVNAQIPKDFQSKGVTGTLTSLDVDFLETNEVMVDLSMDLSGFGLSGTATGSTVSALTYRDGDFFLSDIDFSDITILPDDESKDKITDSTNVVTSMWSKFKEDKLADDSKDETIASLERLKDGALEKAKPAAISMANNALKNIPVYSLNGKDFKMDMAALALEDVSFTGESVEVTLDPRNVILWFLGCALIVAFAMILGLGMAMGAGGGAGIAAFSLLN